MIDKTGKKIQNAGDVVDLEFAKKEINFFMKGVALEYSDSKVYSVVKMIYEYLENDGDPTDTYDHVNTLEQYVKVTENDDFLWHLVYIRRLYANKRYRISEYKWAAEQRYAAARYFEDICRVNPSWYNMNVRIWDYTISALYAFDHGDFQEVCELINTVLTRARELFDELEPRNEEAYYDTGRLLYYCSQLYLQKKKSDKGEEFLEYLRKLTYYGRELYRTNKSNTTYLNWVIKYYEIGSQYIGFICRDEYDNICMISRWAQEQIDSENSDFPKYIDRLNKLKSVYE